MTMQVYTDPKLLDVRGALDSLPMLPLGAGNSGQQSMSATGTVGKVMDLRRNPLAPMLAPTLYNPVQKQSIPVKMAEGAMCESERGGVGVKSIPVNAKGPLTSIVNEPLSIGVTGFEPATSWSRTKRSKPS